MVNEGRPEIAIYYSDQPTDENRHVKVASDYAYLLMEDFARAIDTDGDAVVDARAGRAIAATVQAAVDSGRSGKPEAVA